MAPAAPGHQDPGTLAVAGPRNTFSWRPQGQFPRPGDCMVEAAGDEHAPYQDANWLVARNFRRSSPGIRCLVLNSLCSGVLPSLGDMLETSRARRRSPDA